MKLQALIFDWDGTIQDSMPEQYKGCCAVFNAAGIAPPSLEYFCQTLSMPFADWFISRGVTCFTDEERTRIFRSATNKEKCPLFPEAKEQLGIMRLNKVKLGIVTSARWPIINKLIEVHGLQGLFEAVTC
jgi:beta-phosphoglucomutase-like phosphatase (HAD superfamily)